MERALQFHLVPEITLGLAVLVGSYLYAVSPLNHERRVAVAWPRLAMFLAGAATIFVALHPPIDSLAEEFLFSLHMVQHILIALVAPPLLIAGIPGWLLAPIVRAAWVRRLGRLLTRPPVAFALGIGTFWIWHMPTLYDFALQNRPVHDLEHLSIMIGAAIMWWPVVSPTPAVPQARRPVQLLYLFLLSLPSGFLSALLVFSPEPLYATYAAAAPAAGIDALQDQQIGGLIMKLGGTLILWTVLSVYFIQWMNRVPSNQAATHRAVR